jgi:serine/threonine protein kinase
MTIAGSIMAADATKRTGLALLVGIGDYERADRIGPLPYAPRDARALARLFLDPGVCGFARERIVLLTGPRARRERIVHRLSRWLPAEGRGADLVVIYFAGHGVVEKVGQKEDGFLLPYDADPDDVVRHGVAMSDLAHWIERIEAQAVVVCLDCCHAGKVILREGVSLRSAPRDMQVRPALMQQIAGKGRFLIASCGEGQKSLEVPELKHGLFTYHLLKGLAGEGDGDGDGRVGVAELFTYVSRAVARDAREKFGVEQDPWTSAAWAGDVYISAPGGSRRSRPAPAAPPPNVTEIEKRLDTALGAGDEPAVIEALRLLRRARDPAAVPWVFRCLPHPSGAVRDRARKALQALGWEKAAAAAEELARRHDEERLGFVLEGLAALEAHADVVRLLDRLVFLLHGNLRQRAVFLLERKRLGLELDRIAAIFREKQSPYRIERVLGPGLFTAAYLAREELTGLEVVVRVLRPEFAAQPLVRTEFLDLSSRSIRLVHQNMVLTREVRAFADREIYYTVRDYVAGATLREVLESGRRFDPLQGLRIVRKILQALTPLHRAGHPHGGVKPSNVFLAKDDRVVLGDLSLPVPLTGVDLKRLAYDFRYVAPELFRGGGAAAPASDLYALGCVAYELLCGEPPFMSDNPYELITRHDRDPIAPLSQRVSALGATGQAFLDRLLARSPAGRFASLEETLASLQAVERWLRDGPKPQPSGAVSMAQAPPWDSVMREAPPAAPAAADSVHLLDEASLARYGGGVSLVGLSEPGGFTTVNPNFSQPGSGSLAPSGPFALPAIPGYEILEELGRGGMGRVYKARQLSLNRVVALKVLPGGGYTGPEALARFKTEAEAVARLQHPNIVQIYDVGEHQGVAYFSMEFVDGGTLARSAKDSPLAPEQAARLIELLARALHHAHSRGIIHRDVKPGNVLLTVDGAPKLTDFGLARRQDDEEHLTMAGAIIGTPAYMSPEQAGGMSRAVGPPTDIWGLGATLYELLTGQLPFRSGPPAEMLLRVLHEEPPRPRALAPTLDRDLETICLKCLEKEPTRRYASAEALADDLHRFLAGGPIVNRPASRLERALKWSRRRPAAALALAGLVALSSLCAALLYLLLTGK